MPNSIADVVDRQLAKQIEPYLREIQNLTLDKQIDKMSRELTAQVTGWIKNGWIGEDTAVVESWRDRVMRFRNNKALIGLRIHPYQRVPDLLNSESRRAVLEIVATARAQLLSKKKLFPVKHAAQQFLEAKITREQLDGEWIRLAKDAAEKINNNDAPH
jgi:hypothetical protein